MVVPTSEVGYTPAMTRSKVHEVHKDVWWWHWTKIRSHKLVIKRYERNQCEKEDYHNIY